MNSAYYPVLIYLGTGLVGSALEYVGARWKVAPLESLGRRMEGLGLDVFKCAARGRGLP